MVDEEGWGGDACKEYLPEHCFSSIYFPMADRFSKERRSLVMASVRSRDTKPELLVRSLLHRLGFRFRVNVTGLPGRPDIVLRRHQTTIFVHGCFWHRHKGCAKTTFPASNMKYWQDKFDSNIARDIRTAKHLRRLGWKVIVVWECELTNVGRLTRRLVRLLS